MKLLLNSIVGSLFFMFLSTAYAEFPANDSTKISGDTLKELLSGKVRHCKHPNGSRYWDFSFYADGKLKAANSNWSEAAGTWSISSRGAVCYEYSSGNFTDACHIMYQNPPV